VDQFKTVLNIWFPQKADKCYRN